MSAEHPPELEPISREQLILQVMDFIDSTARFYHTAMVEAAKSGKPLSPLISVGLSTSTATINQCLAQIGGIPHYVENGPARINCTFQRFEGFDFGKDMLLWQATDAEQRLGQVEVKPAVLDEIRQKYSEPIHW